MASQPEAWLRGPVAGIPPLLMPVAHALIQAREELETAAAGLSPVELWIRPGGAAAVGFHLRHIVGSLDRLLTYAQGNGLTPEQRAALESEGVAGTPPATAAELLAAVNGVVESALATLRGVREEALLDCRPVGRARLPSTLLGLLFHAAEHTQRHTGQVVTTAKIIRGVRDDLSPSPDQRAP